MSNRDWLLIFVYLYIIGVYCQQVYRSLKKDKVHTLCATTPITDINLKKICSRTGTLQSSDLAVLYFFHHTISLEADDGITLAVKLLTFSLFHFFTLDI